MAIQIVGHTSFLGQTGYNSHSQNFFTNLNRYIPTRIRNYTYTPHLTDFENQYLDLLIVQYWQDPPYKIGKPFYKNKNDTVVNLVLNESHHYYFYDKYDHPMIAYNVWESTRQLPEFFKRLLDYDQFWCPTEWQRQCTIEQGYPEDRVKVVHEGVDGSLFYPGTFEKEKHYLFSKYDIPDDAFVFMIFGRWDYRKAITEMIQIWNSFKYRDKTYLVLSVDNPFSVDGLKSTEERLKFHGLENDKIRILHFPQRDEYIKWMKYGSCLLSCSRAEGWNLPLMECLACGTPAICSDWGGHLEFADGLAHKVQIRTELPPKDVFMIGDGHDLGLWGEPDFNNLEWVMNYMVEKYHEIKPFNVKMSKLLREAFSWDNAARKAQSYIDELVTNKYHQVKLPDNKVKLNLGCGNDIREGYINIDKYNNTNQVDLNCDFAVLPFSDESVDEIYTSHIFEHILINDVYGVLDEWARVLKEDGILIIRMPNLEHEINIWLNSPDDKKWSEVHRIFGDQNHEGNTHYNGHNPESLKWLIEKFDFEVVSCKMGNSGFGEEIQLEAKKVKKGEEYKPIVNIHFVDGPFAEIKGDANDKGFYIFDFLDPDNNSTVHQQRLGINGWTRPYRKYYTNWIVKLSRNSKEIFKHVFDLKGKNVLVNLDSRSLGDTIAWIPQVEKFRKQKECNVIVSSFWNNLFIDSYDNLKFIQPGKEIDNLYASYTVGCFEGNSFKNKNDWRTVPLSKVCSDTLGIDYQETICNLGIQRGKRPIEEPYVAISEFSTFNCKHWLYPNGWQEIVDHLNNIGYKVMSISKEDTNLKNVIKMNNRPIEETINNIDHSEFFIGISSGPSWLSWALRIPTILISGFSAEFSEFQSNCYRVINKDVCHGCFNKTNNNFDRGDWNWCPFQKGTEREFECTKTITPEMVKKEIVKIVTKGNQN